MIYTLFTRVRFTIETNLEPAEAMNRLECETVAAPMPYVRWSSLFAFSAPVFIGRISESGYYIGPNSRFAKQIVIEGIFNKTARGTTVSGTIMSTTVSVIFVCATLIFSYACIANHNLSPLLFLAFFFGGEAWAIHREMKEIISNLHRIYASHLVGPDGFQVSVLK